MFKKQHLCSLYVRNYLIITCTVFLQLTSPNIKTEWSQGFDDACYFIAGQIEIERSLIVAMYQIMFCPPAQHRKKC